MAGEELGLLGEVETVVAGVPESFEETIRYLVTEEISEKEPEGIGAVIPDGLGRLEMDRFDRARSIEEGVHDREAELLGFFSGGERAADPVHVVVDSVVNSCPEFSGFWASFHPSDLPGLLEGRADVSAQSGESIVREVPSLRETLRSLHMSEQKTVGETVRDLG
jgi:hypothetical protein